MKRGSSSPLQDCCFREASPNNLPASLIWADCINYSRGYSSLDTQDPDHWAHELLKVFDIGDGVKKGTQEEGFEDFRGKVESIGETHKVGLIHVAVS